MDIIKYQGAGGAILLFIFCIMFITSAQKSDNTHEKETYSNLTLCHDERHTPICKETLEEILDVSRRATVPPAARVSFRETKDTVENWLDLILPKVKHFEGYYSEPYNCPAGVRTVGYGHTGKYKNQKVSHSRAKEILIEELNSAAEKVDRIVEVELTENQKAALVSFTFNAGEGNLRKLVSGQDRLNSGNYNSIEIILPMYRKGGGRILRGLERRRKWELSVWNGEYEDES
jgi:lysozyme